MLSNDSLSCQSKTASWAGVRSNKGVTRDAHQSSNKFYYEIHFVEAGLARLGWSLANANLDLGTCRGGFGYGGTAKKSNNRQFENYGVEYGTRNDVVGACIDLDNGELSYTKNGQLLGVAFSLGKNLTNEAIFMPTICVKNAQCSARFNADAKDSNSKTKPPPCYRWIGDCLNQTTQIVANPNVDKSSSNSNQSKQDTNQAASPKAIIIEPSRELAEQTLKNISDFKRYLPQSIKELIILGGINVKEQLDQLKKGVDIIVATPHRLEDLVEKGHISLNDVRFFIIDEIDALLAQNNMRILSSLHSRMPKMFADGRRLQLIVCSATLHNFEVKKFAEKLMYFPSWVDLKGEDSVPDTVHHVVMRVDPRKLTYWKNLAQQSRIQTDGVHLKDHLNPNNPNLETYSEAIKILKGDLVIKAIDSLKIDQAIVFCRTKIDCDNLEAHLNLKSKSIKSTANPYSCVCLHADRLPPERTANLDAFKKKKVNFLICTDVAARGIDIKGVPFVLQVTLPDDKANYLHRIGRVGRAERMGLAICFVSQVNEKVWYHSCQSRGKSCANTKLKQEGGCCIWYNELGLLGEIEEHLNCTIPEIYDDFKIETNEFDGKVVYGAKKKSTGGTNYQNHAEELKNIVNHLGALEREVQLRYINLFAKQMNVK